MVLAIAWAAGGQVRFGVGKQSGANQREAERNTSSMAGTRRMAYATPFATYIATRLLRSWRAADFARSRLSAGLGEQSSPALPSVAARQAGCLRHEFLRSVTANCNCRSTSLEMAAARIGRGCTMARAANDTSRQEPNEVQRLKGYSLIQWKPRLVSRNLEASNRWKAATIGLSPSFP